jgi:hypothetical protein
MCSYCREHEPTNELRVLGDSGDSFAVSGIDIDDLPDCEISDLPLVPGILKNLKHTRTKEA